MGLFHLNIPPLHPLCKKSIYEKSLESKLHRKYVSNLLNETQHLAKIKTLKLLSIPNKGITDVRERKLENNKLKLRQNKTKRTRKMSTLVFQSQG